MCFKFSLLGRVVWSYRDSVDVGVWGRMPRVAESLEKPPDMCNSFSLTISLRAECPHNQLMAFFIVFADAIPLHTVSICQEILRKKTYRDAYVCFTLSDVDLLVCKHQGPSCCTRKMEESYQFAVRRETLHNIHSYSYELEHLLSGHSDAFQGKCMPLLPSLSWMGLVWEAGENIGVVTSRHSYLPLVSNPKSGRREWECCVFLPWMKRTFVRNLVTKWFFFSSSSVHQGHSNLHVSQHAAQKCGHSFTFLPSSLLLWVWQEQSCGDETVGEKKGVGGGFKGPFLRLWSLEEVDLLCHYLILPSGQHNSHWSPWINYSCLEERQPMYTNYFVCLCGVYFWLPFFLLLLLLQFLFSGLVTSDVSVPDKWGSARHTKAVSWRFCLPSGFVLHPTESANAPVAQACSSFFPSNCSAI